MYSSGKPIFMLIRKDGCPPCEETKPEWMKIPHSSEVNTRNIVIADVEEQALNLLDFMKPPVNIVGFPTMVHIKNKQIYPFEEGRTVDAFVNWIKSTFEKSGAKSRAKYTVKKGGAKSRARTRAKSRARTKRKTRKRRRVRR